VEGNEQAGTGNYNIELKNVRFAYHEGEDVIRNISLSIPQGSVTALAGPSGSGKSTLSRLIARFWDPREGEIFIGGRNIAGIAPETLMACMSFVCQDMVLFNDTVKNTIRAGREGASDEEVYAAARTARRDEFIRELPEGCGAVIGSTLSGGERQRVSIARALLKNAPIVLPDEAAASLDPENETLIQEAVSELVKNQTVIVIAHRLRAVLGADKIAVLDQGRIAEEGPAAELLAKAGLFARLYTIQQKNLSWTMAR
jgi:ATP-binding cassette subfamily B protein